MDEKRIRLAAAWIFRNQHVGYWTFPAILPAIQSDKYIQDLNMSNEEAVTAFLALEDKGFLKKIEGKFITINGCNIQTYRMNWDKFTEFRDFASLSFLEKHLSVRVFKFLKQWEKVLIACIIIIATAFIQSCFEVFGTELGTWITGLIP